MNIRKFEAGSFEEALHRVKTELGPDALILASEEKRKGWFQKPTVEVTAAFEPDKEWDDSALERIFPYRKQHGPKELEQQTADPKKRAGARGPVTAMGAAARAVFSDETAELESSFLDAGLRVETARDFARQIVFDFPKRDRQDPEFLEKIKVKQISSGVKTLGPDVFQTRRSWAVVGSPGAGKTTLLVKLALNLKSRDYSVVLGSSDTRKVIGRHELAAYARLIGAPLHAGRTLEKKAGQIQLLDTPSISVDQAELFREVEKNCRDYSTLVVLDASLRLNEILRTVERLSRLAPVALAFTRLDLVSDAGVVYEVLKQTKLPLLGLSVSYSFSSAFRFHEPASLARYLIRKPSDSHDQRQIIDSAASEADEDPL